MTALQRVLEKMPDEKHRQSFMRIVNEAAVKEDSPDMVFLALDHEARWAAVEAMADERRRIQALLENLPDAIKAAGAEIVRGLADKIAAETMNRIATAGIAAIESHAIAFFASADGRLTETLQAFGDGCASVTRSLDGRTNEAVKRLDEASSRVTVHAQDIKNHHRSAVSFMAGVHNRLWAVLLVVAVLSGIAVYAFDHASIFHTIRAALAHER